MPVALSMKPSFRGVIAQLSKPWIWLPVSLIVLYSVAGFLIAPWAAQRALIAYSTETLKRPLAIQRLRLNPFTFTLALDQFELKDTDGHDLLAFERLHLDFKMLDLFHRLGTLDEISVSAPRVAFRILNDGQSNIARLMEDAGSEATHDTADAAAPAKAPFGFLVKHLAMEGGAIAFRDARHRGASIVLSPIDIELNQISTRTSDHGQYSVSAKLPQGGAIVWEGSLSLSPPATAGRLVLSDFGLKLARPFIEDLEILDELSGTLGLQVEYSLALGETPGIEISRLEARLRDFSGIPAGTPVPAHARIGEAGIDLKARIALDEVPLEFALDDLAIRLADLDYRGVEAGSPSLSLSTGELLGGRIAPPADNVENGMRRFDTLAAEATIEKD